MLCDSVFYILNWFLCYMKFCITYIMIENWLVDDVHKVLVMGVLYELE